ncbi:OmpA family protein [Yeosuana marina]|uniref:OmpA family protein n=1 Tax=Yeosuana marina TaxID=1565536 RepID=UPI0030C89A29
MKKQLLLHLILTILFFSCKKDLKETESTTKIETLEETLIEDNDEEIPQIDVSELMNVMGGLISGGAAKDSSGQGMFLSNGQLNVDFLKSDAGKPMRKTFAQIAEVTLEEVDLSLTIMPDNDIVSVKHAQAIEEDLNNPKVEAYVKSGKASGNFLELITDARTEAKKRTTNFKKLAQIEKEKFYKDNPTWFALDESMEDTYIDYRENMVYLPLGDASFADEVVEFIPGKPKGRAPKGALGPAQGRLLTLEDCATLGIKGVLTLYFKDNSISDVNGPDIYVFEIGQIEPTNIEISKNGKDWINVGKIEGGTAGLDIHDFVQPGDTFNYIRLTDLDTYSGMPGADIDAVAAIGGALRMNLDSAVLFETGKYKLKEEGIKAIRELALKMKNIQKGTITVEGHTDDVGSEATNKSLSLARAKSVSAELKKLIPNTAFKWKEMGFGESKPLVDNNSEENRAKNRRVEILILPN